MKLHFKPKATIISTPPKAQPIRHKQSLIYYSSSTICILCLTTNKIFKKIKFPDIQILKIVDDRLYICTSDIYIMDLLSYEIIDTIKLSKALINRMSLYKNDIIVSKVNNKVLILSEKKKLVEFSVNNFCEGLFLNQFFYGYYDLEKVVVFSKSHSKLCEKTSEGILGVIPVDGKIFLFESCGKLSDLLSSFCISFETNFDVCQLTEEYILAVSKDFLFKLGYDGNIVSKHSIIEMISDYSGTVCNSFEQSKDIIQDFMSLNQKQPENKKFKLDLNISLSSNETSENSSEDSRISSENSDEDSQVSTEDNLEDSQISLENSLEDSQASSEDNSEEFLVSSENNIEYLKASEDTDDSSENGASSPGFILVDSTMIMTPDNSILLFEDVKICKILSFLDDITDSIKFNDFLILSTSSGYLKYTSLAQYENGHEYVCDSKIVRISFSPIISTKLWDDLIFVGFRDKTCKVFKVVLQDNNLIFDLIFQLSCFSSSLTSLAFVSNVLAISSSDCILSIFKSPFENFDHFISSNQFASDSILHKQMLFLSTFENINTQKIHSKPINHIAATDKYIITSSSDKTSKFLDHNGILVKTVQSDKILNSAVDPKYIAICSHKSIKVFHNSSLAQLAVFQVRKPVLSSCFYNGYLLTASDVLRLYDLDSKKCVKSYDLELVNCWSFNFPFLCAQNKIVILEDVSLETQRNLLATLRELKEESIFIDKFLRENRYKEAIEALLKKNDFKVIKEALIKGFYYDRSLSFLEEIMSNGEKKNKIFDCLLKNSSFKNAEIFNHILWKYNSGENDKKLDKSKNEKIGKIVRKHCESIEGLFIDLLGFEMLEKNFD